MDTVKESYEEVIIDVVDPEPKKRVQIHTHSLPDEERDLPSITPSTIGYVLDLSDPYVDDDELPTPVGEPTDPKINVVSRFGRSRTLYESIQARRKRRELMLNISLVGLLILITAVGAYLTSG